METKYYLYNVVVLMILCKFQVHADRVGFLERKMRIVLGTVTDLNIELNIMREKMANINTSCTCDGMESESRGTSYQQALGELETERKSNENLRQKVLQLESELNRIKLNERSVQATTWKCFALSRAFREEKRARIDGISEIRRSVTGFIEEVQQSFDIVNSSILNFAQESKLQCNETSQVAMETMDALVEETKELLNNSVNGIKVEMAHIKSEMDLLNEVGVKLEFTSNWTEWGQCTGSPPQGQQQRTRHWVGIAQNITASKGEITEVCPDHYNRLPGYRSCLFVIHGSVNHADAVELCQLINGHLVYIDSEEKKRAVAVYLSWDYYSDWWDEIWVDGERHGNVWKNWRGEIMTFFDWSSGEPDDEDIYIQFNLTAKNGLAHVMCSLEA